VTPLQRRLDDLHLRFQLHFADHVRLTRDLPLLDRLLAEVEAVVQEARAQAPTEPDAAWTRLFDTAERRVRTYVETRGAIAQAQAVTGLRDRDASLLTARARLVLHRYVRHFAGQDRRTRDPGQMDEMIEDLLGLFAQMRPLLGKIQVPSVVEEIEAVGEFLGFFHVERREIATAWNSGGRDDQSRALGLVADELYAAWNLLILAEERALRRPGLLDRLVASLDRVLEALMTIRHANMSDDHEVRIARAARELVRWQDERTATLDARESVTPTERAEALQARALAVFRTWREQLSGELAARDLQLLRGLCDRMDEIERQLTDLPQLVTAEQLAWVRDVLVAMERTFDQVVAAKADQKA
jgi:hypothetical protein